MLAREAESAARGRAERPTEKEMRAAPRFARDCQRVGELPPPLLPPGERAHERGENETETLASRVQRRQIYMLCVQPHAVIGMMMVERAVFGREISGVAGRDTMGVGVRRELWVGNRRAREGGMV